VFPVHGSGVGSGLVAARILAEAIAGFDDPGCERATWAYQAAFHRERGGVHAAYDVMRRATQRLDARTLDTLLASGLVSQQSTAAALAQELHSPTLGEIARLARSATRAPRAAAGLVGAALRMPAVVALYKRYPTTVDVRALRRWARGAAALCGHAADVRAQSRPLRAALDASST
jgi:flavin-dependent dehydrogenase